MEQNPNVVIVMSCCAHNRESFGIRIEEQKQGKWMADWAFPVQAGVAKREGYDHNEISGTIEIASKYPGCPYCEARSFIRCNCDKVSCWNTHSAQITCPWCDQTGQVSDEQITRLKVVGDL